MLFLLNLEVFRKVCHNKKVDSWTAAARQAWLDHKSSITTTNGRQLAQAELYNTTIYNHTLGSGWSTQTLGVANNYSQVAGAGTYSDDGICATLQPGVCYYHPSPTSLSGLTPVT